MPRLRRVSVSSPGFTRRRSGKGFTYLDTQGRRITDPEVLARCRGLAVPPAWTDVWICPVDNGHVQAFGHDAAGRGQYIYHPQWRERRDRAKHDHVLLVGARLPAARRRVARDLRVEGMPRERVLALAFRLLDVGYFRLGGEAYAQQNESYGLSTLLKEHVTARTDGTVQFCFPAKSGQVRELVLDDPDVHAAVRALRARRGGERLLAWQVSSSPVEWREVTSSDVSAHVKDLLGDDASPKDFRTWHATVLAAQGLADAGAPPSSDRRRRSVVTGVVREVAAELGNTPAVCRASYIDPRLFDLWERGRTISPTRSTRAAEAAVLDLLG
ncbi:DNA topoisomerase IB [Sanguibacter suaedae]|uniref:DNA topoisomerase n=1 Tax=Sanguibacter suaedae TaxID=2795737 RepID=A0A934MDS7_9MICO|nr:DNA topoisomerase IB [Sanguibacter suaedae]MBI9115064.1 DNA topoisomerase IB [Sanguibacter suaedae]